MLLLPLKLTGPTFISLPPATTDEFAEMLDELGGIKKFHRKALMTAHAALVAVEAVEAVEPALKPAEAEVGKRRRRQRLRSATR